MVRRRAANVVGDTIELKTGSSLYSRIGMTHMSTPYFRISAGRTVSSRFASQACWVSACSRRVPNGLWAWGSARRGEQQRGGDGKKCLLHGLDH